MDYEKLLGDLVRALASENPSGFFYRKECNLEFCIAECAQVREASFRDHKPSCPYRLAVEALAVVRYEEGRQ